MLRLTQLVLALLTVGLLVAANVAAAQTPCGPRVRRAYSKLSADDRITLKLAFERAMQLGHHHRFVAVHQYYRNEYEAHSCMLVYWHRRFLWGYENMLRSLGEEFQCITLPF
ncbi:hypothetical protein H310_05427 [Aphanomyces invadans]|uniref:Tyrosinase copper-binding domain-containing protein n=1 Tax=Aphanomyces invadans TaxID=157072 RepID=A0A024UAT2_9STRA|nr:hypothetical protein H310_05427 [Aphanomyces invadans]ETW02987.1 hypothetical protein H310_05427 [Aphanomyces invadans]|eukprot:XP_008868371.1 hypothetical protein H310_05427 [Aphanomyces invadans]